jgi:aspartate/methionine/tyrosine aminotransferase
LTQDERDGFCTWLMLAGYSQVHYLPPVYYKFAYLFKQYNIQPVPVSDLHAFQSDFELRLPKRRTLLVLTDPIWYAGAKVPCEVLDAIKAWQLNTGSLVFVDGTFQYMQWDGTSAEISAQLPPDQTLRMICPTKFLSLHGYRCAWLLVPKPLRDKLAELHLNLHGEASLADGLFAHRACDVMLHNGNRRLLDYVQRNYQRLLDKDAVDGNFDVETGYFLFARPRAPRAHFLSMGQDFFELNGYPNHMRITCSTTPRSTCSDRGRSAIDIRDPIGSDAVSRGELRYRPRRGQHHESGGPRRVAPQ